MPRLHKYRNRNACYVLTAIGGAVVTFQLTPEGESKLTSTGIAPGQLFPRALLLDLYRTGDAFTRGSGVDEAALPGARQMEIDFANDPEPDTAFPACAYCRSVDDLNLTLTGAPDKLAAKLQCATCRAKAAAVDTSVPLALLSLSLLTRLFGLKVVADKDPSVIQFEELLGRELQSRWEDLRRLRGASQATLFDTPQGGELI